MVFRDLILNAKVVEQRLRTGVLSHHNPQASVNGDEEEHRQNACPYRRCCQHFSAHSRRLFQHPQGLSPSISECYGSRRLERILAARHGLQLRSLLQAFGANGQHLRHLSDDVVPEIAFSCLRYFYQYRKPSLATTVSVDLYSPVQGEGRF